MRKYTISVLSQVNALPEMRTEDEGLEGKAETFSWLPENVTFYDDDSFLRRLLRIVLILHGLFLKTVKHFVKSAPEWVFTLLSSTLY